MNQLEQNIPFLSADFGEVGGRYQWETPHDLVKWVGQIRDAWKWVSEQGQVSTNNAWNAISNSLNKIIASAQAAQNHIAKPNQQGGDANNTKTTQGQMERLFGTQSWLLPDQAKRHFVEKLRDAGRPLEAALIVAAWMKQDLNGAPIRVAVSSLIELELYERGNEPRLNAVHAALEGLAAEMRTTLTEYQETKASHDNQFATLYETLAMQSVDQQRAFDAAQVVRDGGWTKQIDASQQELLRITETYDKHMALAAPVSYWESKRIRHGRWAIASFVAAFICMVAFGWLLHSELQGIGDAMETKRTTGLAGDQKSTLTAAPSTSIVSGKGTNQGTSTSSPSLPTSALESAATWKLGSFILLATLSFWFIRLLVRIFLSNLHLENDAAERVTMVKTYLAMIRDDAMPRAENISTVLAALFRPTGDGIVKDEGLPPTAMEWLTKLGGK